MSYYPRVCKPSKRQERAAASIRFNFLLNILTKGTRFNTDAECNCVVIRSPDQYGEFLALDSDQVECSFNVNMVTRVIE